MDRSPSRTLQAIFAHPLAHGVHGREVEQLCRALGAEVEPLADHRLRIRMPSGAETWIRIGSGVHHPDLDAEALLRVRRLLQEAGVSPEHPQAEGAVLRGDQSRRLVLVIDHAATRAYRLEGETVKHAELRPHGVWGSGERLSHRHDRDLAGQRAPLDADYLRRLTALIADADAVLLIGHGSGESDVRQHLLGYLERHRHDLRERIVASVRLDSGGLSDRAVLAEARRHFGNPPRRRPVQGPGQEHRPG